MEGEKSLTSAYESFSEKSSSESYTKTFPKFSSNQVLLGCLAQITHLPIAKASALVVATTSLVLGFTNALQQKSAQTQIIEGKKNTVPKIIYGSRNPFKKGRCNSLRTLTGSYSIL